MTAQHIEFYLHPPSPVQTERFVDRPPPSDTVAINENLPRGITKLPSVSSLLSYASDADNDTKSILSSDLPLISLPSPSVSSSRNSVLLEPEPLEMYGNNENSSYEKHSSNNNQSTSTGVSSPSSLSPFLGALSLVDTASSTSSSAPLTPATPGYQQQQQSAVSPNVLPHPSQSQLLLLPPPTNTRRSRSLSNASSASTCSYSTIESYNSNYSSSTTATTPASPPLLKVSKSQPKSKASLSSSTPYVKRKRGRPPNNNNLFQTISASHPSSTILSSPHSSYSQHQQQGHHQFIETHPAGQQQNGGNQFTFLTPTVWNVKGKDLPPAPAGSSNGSQHNAFAGSITTQNQQRACWPANTFAPSPSPSLLTKTPEQVYHLQHTNPHTTTAAPTGSPTSNTTTTLDIIPTKKRGRRPKVQLAGNFCFVWRDLTAKRGANKKKLLKQQQTSPTNTSTTTTATATTTTKATV